MTQHRLKFNKNDQEPMLSLVKVKRNKKEIATIDREKFSLAKYLCSERGFNTMQKIKGSNRRKKVENGIVVQIINEKIHEISVSKLNYLFKDKLIYLFAPIELIKKIINPEFDISLGYVERGNAYSLIDLRRYINCFLHNNNVDFSQSKNFEEIFNVIEYQDIKRDSKKLEYIFQCFEKIPNLFIFPTHDGAADYLKIEKIKNLNFDGFLIPIMREEREIIGICVNSKITSYRRRIITIMSLYFSYFNCPRKSVIVFNVEEGAQDRDVLFLKIGDLLIGQNKKYELLDIENPEELDKQAKHLGVSYSFLNWYLFYNDNRIKFNNLQKELKDTKNVNPSNGGPKPNIAIKHFLRPKTISSVSGPKVAQLVFQNSPVKEAKRMFIRYKI